MNLAGLAPGEFAKPMPQEMLKISGSVNMVRKAGIASSSLSHGICLTSSAEMLTG
jgi:hypothetical protein